VQPPAPEAVAAPQPASNQPVVPPASSPAPAQNPSPYYQQPKPAPAPEATPYDFFLEPQQKTKKKILKTNSKLNKLILAAGALIVVLILVGLVVNLTQSGSKQATSEFTSITSSQQEIIRVSNLGMLHVGSDNLRNFSSTAIADMTSSQQQVIDYAATNGVTIDTKLLAASSNARIDSSLDAAEAASTYDATFRTVMLQLLQDHQAKLERLQKSATAPTERTILSNNLASDLLLQQMLNQ